MQSRRDLITLGASATLAALGVAPDRLAARASLADSSPASLETRLFNFKEDVSPGRSDAIIAKLKDLAGSPGVDGLLVGRNFIPALFPTRFEWIYMIQFGGLRSGDVPSGAAYGRFRRVRDELSHLCRDDAECDLIAPLPRRFADAPGVKVRHTVMFNFRADASPAARERNVAAIRDMGNLPMVQNYLVRRNAVMPPDGAPGPAQMEWQVIGDFGSVDDYKAYSQAPVHLAIRDDFRANTSRVAFLDVEP